jgi:hypothetical protein
VETAIFSDIEYPLVMRALRQTEILRPFGCGDMIPPSIFGTHQVGTTNQQTASANGVFQTIENLRKVQFLFFAFGGLDGAGRFSRRANERV